MNKHLTRSDTNRIIGGVCGGIAEYFNFDATLIRIGFLFLGIFAGGGVLFYLILWVIMPSPKLIGVAFDQQIKLAVDDMVATVKKAVNTVTGWFK